jgi:hypothetical protein
MSFGDWRLMIALTIISLALMAVYAVRRHNHSK